MNALPIRTTAGAPAELPPLELLRAFVGVYDAGSFTGAAVRLGRHQSTISYAVRKLEDQLGVLLFNRRRHRAIAPTSAAHELVGPVRSLLQAATDLAMRLATKADVVRRIGIAEELAPDGIGAFSKARAAVAGTLSLRFGRPRALAAAFKAGELDALVSYGREPRGRPIGTERLVWVTRPNARTSDRLRIVMPESGEALGDAAVQSLRDASVPYTVAAVVAGALVGTFAAIEDGLGVAVATESSVPAHLCIDDDLMQRAPLGWMTWFAEFDNLGIPVHVAESMENALRTLFS